MTLLEEIENWQNLYRGDLDRRDLAISAYDLLERASNMIEELKQAFNCEGCRGPKPLCHITGEYVCNRRPFHKGE